MEHAHPGYLHYYFVERHLQGYLTATQRHAGRPFWYYLPIVLGGALPWTLHLAGAAHSAPANRLRLVLWGWFAIGLVFLSVGESKLVTYALPLFPALALIVGEHMSARRRRGRSSRSPPGPRRCSSPVMPAAGLDRRAVALRRRSRPDLWLPIALLGAAARLTAGLAGASRRPTAPAASDGSRRRRCARSIRLMLVLPPAAAWMTARDLARALNAGGALPPRVSVLDERIGSLVFYLDPALRAEATPRTARRIVVRGSDRPVRIDPDEAVVAVRNGQLRSVQPPVPGRAAGPDRAPAPSRSSAPLQRRFAAAQLPAPASGSLDGRRAGGPSTSIRGAMPRPGAVDAAMRPFTRCGAPSAVDTVT